MIKFGDLERDKMKKHNLFTGCLIFLNLVASTSLQETSEPTAILVFDKALFFSILIIIWLN